MKNDVNFDELFAGIMGDARTFRLTKRYPNFPKYPETVKTAMLLLDELSEKCTKLMDL